MEPPTLEGLVKELRISLDPLDQRCSDEHLKSISLFLDWRSVAPHLGLSERDIADIEAENRTESERRLKVLQQWKRVFGYVATFKNLVLALLKVRNADDAERVCRLLQTPADAGPTTRGETSKSPYGEGGASSGNSPPAVGKRKREHSSNSPKAKKRRPGGRYRVPYTTSWAGSDSEDEFDCSVEAETPQPGIVPPSMNRDLAKQVMAKERGECSTSQAAVVEVSESPVQPLECNIENEIEELEKEFLNVVDKAAENLENVPLSRIKRCITQLRVSVKYQHKKFLENHLSDIDNAQSVGAIFAILGLYWDFLNCGLLTELVRELGNDETKQLLEQYTEKLRRFRMKTKLGAFIGNWAQSTSPHFVEFETEMGDDWRDRTLEDLNVFRHKLARSIYVEEYALRMKSAKPGSVFITWALQSSLPGMADTLQAAFQVLQKHGVLRMIFQEKCIPDLTSPKSLTSTEHQVMGDSKHTDAERKAKADNEEATITSQEQVICTVQKLLDDSIQKFHNLAAIASPQFDTIIAGLEHSMSGIIVTTVSGHLGGITASENRQAIATGICAVKAHLPGPAEREMQSTWSAAMQALTNTLTAELTKLFSQANASLLSATFGKNSTLPSQITTDIQGLIPQVSALQLQLSTNDSGAVSDQSLSCHTSQGTITKVRTETRTVKGGRRYGIAGPRKKHHYQVTIPYNVPSYSPNVGAIQGAFRVLNSAWMTKFQAKINAERGRVCKGASLKAEQAIRLVLEKPLKEARERLQKEREELKCRKATLAEFEEKALEVKKGVVEGKGN